MEARSTSSIISVFKTKESTLQKDLEQDTPFGKEKFKKVFECQIKYLDSILYIIVVFSPQMFTGIANIHRIYTTLRILSLVFFLCLSLCPPFLVLCKCSFDVSFVLESLQSSCGWERKQIF